MPSQPRSPTGDRAPALRSITRREALATSLAAALPLAAASRALAATPPGPFREPTIGIATFGFPKISNAKLARELVAAGIGTVQLFLSHAIMSNASTTATCIVGLLLIVAGCIPASAQDRFNVNLYSYGSGNPGSAWADPAAQATVQIGPDDTAGAPGFAASGCKLPSNNQSLYPMKIMLPHASSNSQDSAPRNTRIVLWIVAMLGTMPAAQAADRNDPPAVDRDVPTRFSLPADFKPPASGAAGLGIRRYSGVALPASGKTHPIYVTEALAGVLSMDPLKAGDVVLAADGEPLGADPVRQFREIATRESRESGVMWAVRWRAGEVKQVMIDLGTKPLDLTRGAQPNLDHEDWTLGATGAYGWTWAIPHESTEGATQIYVTQVDPGSPADGVLKKGDVILGAFGQRFTRDARKEFGAALAVAESTKMKGRLELVAWRDGKQGKPIIQLAEMGDYTDTSPFDCPKSEKILAEGIDFIRKAGVSEVAGDIGRRIIGHLNALALLATGNPEHLPMVRERAHAVAALGRDLEFGLNKEAWDWGYANLFLTEYFLLTRDESVLPAIREYAVKTAKGQSRVGTWGHSMSVPYQFIDGPRYGIAPGYGALNSAAIPCMISLILARECGVDDEIVETAIQRGSKFFRFFVDKGTIPYGDHEPFIDSHENNGMNSMVAVMFDLLGDEDAATYFTRLTLASFNGREPGHTGNFFSFLWGTLGAARAGPEAAAAFMKELRWFYDFERGWQGNFEYQGKPGMIKRGNGEHSFANWDCTGARLLGYCVPLKKLRITGRGPGAVKPVTESVLAEALAGGRLKHEDYADLTTDKLLALLGSWSPAVRQRAGMALGGKPENVVPQLIAMLAGDDRYARYGACQCLRFAGRGSADAADAVIKHGIGSDDATLRFFAMNAFTHPDPKAGLASQALRVAPALLRLAAAEPPAGPHDRQQLGLVIFSNHDSRNRRPIFPRGEGIDSIDRELLIPAIRVMLKETNGLVRSAVSTIYPKLTESDHQALWGDIRLATDELAPSGIMFASEVRINGLRLMAESRAKEGLESAVSYLRNQKLHGSEQRVEEALKIIIEKYGGHAKAYIPKLRETADYFDAGGDAFFPLPNSQRKAAYVRDAIATIESLPDPTEPLTTIGTP